MATSTNGAMARFQPITLAVNQVGGGVVLATATTNIGAVNLHGIEAEANAAVTQHLNITANFDWQTSKITSYFSAITARINNTTNVNGNVFPNAPVLTWTLTPTYTDHLSGDWDWYSRLDWKHRGKYYADVSNVAWIAPSPVRRCTPRHQGSEQDARNLRHQLDEERLSFLTADQANDPSCCVGATNVNGIPYRQCPTSAASGSRTRIRSNKLNFNAWSPAVSRLQAISLRRWSSAASRRARLPSSGALLVKARAVQLLRIPRRYPKDGTGGA